MKLFLLPAFALLLHVVQATPVLKFESTNLNFDCSDIVEDVMVGNVNAAVNEEAIARGYISADSQQYLGLDRRRNLRSNGERRLGFCSNNGCPANNHGQNEYGHCWIIGCYRRRELDETRELQGLQCPALVGKANAALKVQAAMQRRSIGSTGAMCGDAFDSITVSCEE